MGMQNSKSFDDIKNSLRNHWFKVTYEPQIVIKGPLTKEKILELSEMKEEPSWMTEMRLKAYEWFKKLPLPDWGPDLSEIDFDDMIYYASPELRKKPENREDIPEYIKRIFKKLGISEEETKMLAGFGLQFDSSVVYKKVKKYLEQLGVIFTSMDEAVIEYSDIVKRYFGKIVPYLDNKFAALNTAVWSGGTFIYVPEGVKVPFPLHTYFRMNLEGIGQFERTLIIVEKNAEITYIEGCSAPLYSKASLHASVVEVIAKENSKVRYITLQNWSKNVYNLAIKRAILYNNTHGLWISAEFGSKVTMVYPGLILKGNYSKGEIYNISFATDGQTLDTGGKAIHVGKNSRSIIVSRSISIGKEKKATSIYRGDIKILKGSENSKSISQCDSLVEGKGTAEALPRIENYEKSSYFNHEAKIERLDEDKMFYLMARGISKDSVRNLVYIGFFEDVLKKIPFKYAMEVRKLINLELDKYGDTV
ncbi:MAG TPA: Fe-S cluster assembly protein SufB [Candidatus Nanopusillus sp.]|nr:Fe-S cluster assembly protein SufB [Candidatus Nanopusillus sp.]